MHRIAAAAFALVSITSTAHAATATGSKKECQVTVPDAWTQDKVLKTSWSSPDGKASVLVANARPKQSLDAQKKATLEMFKGSTVVDEANGVVLIKAPGKNPSSGDTWYALTAHGAGSCSAVITVKDAAHEADAKAIAHSLKAL